jgi:hypothetical protein
MVAKQFNTIYSIYKPIYSAITTAPKGKTEKYCKNPIKNRDE